MDNSFFPTAGTTDYGWSPPVRVDVNEFENRIEFLYKQTSMMTLLVWPAQPQQKRVFKIVFSCVDGKWHKSNPIYGKIIPAKEEHYEFTENKE